MPKITRETTAEADKRLEAGRQTWREGGTVVYIPPTEIDGIPFRSFAELRDMGRASPRKQDRRLEGRRLNDILPLKSIRTMFVSAYSPNKLEYSDEVILAFFNENVIVGAEAFNQVHYGPGRDIYIVTKRGELGILHIFLGPGGRLLYKGSSHWLMPSPRGRPRK